MTQDALKTFSYPYHLPLWISGLFVVLIPLAFWGIYHELSTTGMHTRSGQPVNPWVTYFFIAVLALSWLACVRIFTLSFGAMQRLRLTADALELPKNAFNGAAFRIPYAAIHSVAPHPLKPDILVVKHSLTGMGVHTIQRISLPSRADFELVSGVLLARVNAAHSAAAPEIR